MPMSQSEAGKLGAAKARNIIATKKKQRIEEYEKDPILCLMCKAPLTYEKKRNKYCSHKCSAEFSNSCREGLPRKGRNCSVCLLFFVPAKLASPRRCPECVDIIVKAIAKKEVNIKTRKELSL